MSLIQTNNDLVVDIRNHIAHLTLNRPKALNALTHDMIKSMAALLADWAVDDGIKAIVVRGAGDKAFCAGGDIRALYDLARRGEDYAWLQTFFGDEYQLDFNIHRYLVKTGKPYIAWIDGIVMGGGMGIAQGAAFRIVGGRTKMAMPETAIGMFPDVGGSYFLSRCPGTIGLYLGLTGQTIKAADAIYAGLASHHIASESAFEFDYALDSLIDWNAGPIAAMRDVILKFSRPPIEPATLPLMHDAIDTHFGGKASVAAIIESLKSEANPDRLAWAGRTVDTLSHKSPTMLEVAKRQIERAATMNLAECFRMEMNLIAATFEHGDVTEGIRALIIDKDQAPRWKPPTLADVSPTSVNEFFRPRWDDDAHPLKNLHI